jgi:hypothetical protein
MILNKREREIIMNYLEFGNHIPNLEDSDRINLFNRFKNEDKEPVVFTMKDSKDIFDIWRMAQEYNCDDFHNMVRSVESN